MIYPQADKDNLLAVRAARNNQVYVPTYTYETNELGFVRVVSPGYEDCFNVFLKQWHHYCISMVHAVIVADLLGLSVEDITK